MTDLAQDLISVARQAGTPLKRDVLEAALDAARAPSRRRARALIHLAGALRDHTRYDEALAFLDLVDSGYDDEETIRAAFTCAIAIHGDRGLTSLANMLCDEQRARGVVDLHFLRAETRARRAWLEETGEQAAHAALQRAEAELTLLDDSSAAPIVLRAAGGEATHSD